MFVLISKNMPMTMMMMKALMMRMNPQMEQLVVQIIGLFQRNGNVYDNVVKANVRMKKAN